MVSQQRALDTLSHCYKGTTMEAINYAFKAIPFTNIDAVRKSAGIYRRQTRDTEF